MKPLLAAIFGLSLLSPVASAYTTGFLLDCRVSTSQSGKTVWIGTYDVSGQRAVQYFYAPRYSYCPQILKFDTIY